MCENVLLFSLIFVGDTISIGLYTVCIVDMYDNVYILSLSLISDRDQSLCMGRLDGQETSHQIYKNNLRYDSVSYMYKLLFSLKDP